MKYLSWVVALFVMFWLGNPKLQLRPFSFHFEDWKTLLGVVFLALSLSMFDSKSKDEGRAEGAKMVKDAVIEIIDEEIKNKSKN